MNNKFIKEMTDELNTQKKEFISAHIGTYGEYPQCYMSDLDIDTVFTMRRMLEARILKLEVERLKLGEEEDPMHILILGKQAALFDLLEHLDEFVENQVSKAEDQLGEPMSY